MIIPTGTAQQRLTRGLPGNQMTNRVNVNQAVTVLHASGAAPVWLRDAVVLCRRAVERVDEAVTQVRRGLSR